VPKKLVERTEPNINLSKATVPKEVADRKRFGVHWTGFLTPSETGDYLLGVRSQGFARVSVDGKQVASAGGRGRDLEPVMGRVKLEKGHKVAFYFSGGTQDGNAHTELIWSKYDPTVSPEAVAAREMRTRSLPSSASPASLKAKRCP
jgi:beta-glucosidase